MNDFETIDAYEVAKVTAERHVGIRLPGSPAGNRPIRPDYPESRLAVHWQLLSRGCLRRHTPRVRIRRYPARGNESGTI